MGTVAQAIFLRRDIVPTTDRRKADLLQRTPLEQTLFLIHYLPITWRKWLLDLTRIQANPVSNSTLSSNFYALEPAFVILNIPGQEVSLLQKEVLLEFSSNYYDSELSCSILSYFVRAESTDHHAEFMNVYHETIDKEIKAALYYKPEDPQISYSLLLGAGPQPMSEFTTESRQSRVNQLWQQRIRSFTATHSHDHSPILYPVYTDLKNVSISTHELLMESLYGEHQSLMETSNNTTTLTLLKHYHESGEQIMGSLEVRVSWKYGDLKPRVYYCIGGESYWVSTYVKPIVNFLLQALPSTNPDTRYRVQRLGNISSDQFLVTYDYTSFTTSLTELKHFLHHLSQTLVGTSLRCLDVREGLVDVDAGEYLSIYNETVNVHQEFDLRRILVRKDNANTIFRQGRSGSLGVQGNIGFSTLLHGLSLGSFTSKPDYESDVGDDALTAFVQSLLPSFVEHTNLLGGVHPEKFSILTRPPEDDPTLAERQAFKYLKRPITVDFTGSIVTGCLEFFPSIADFLNPEGDGIHTSTMSTDASLRCRSLCSQWGRYLHLFHHSESLDRTSETDLEIITGAIAVCYEQVGLPIEGGIPGTRYWPNKGGFAVEAEFFIPRCDSTDVFTSDWIEDLMTRHHGERFTSPVRVGGVIPLDPHLQVGSHQRVAGDKLFTLLDDLGYFQKDLMIEESIFDNAYVERLRKLMDPLSNSGELLYDVVLIKELPDWYFPIASENYYHIEPINVEKKLDEIRSVTTR